MERLHFACPKTGRDVDVGIDSEIETLLRIRNKHVIARCPVVASATNGKWAKRGSQQAA